MGDLGRTDEQKVDVVHEDEQELQQHKQAVREKNQLWSGGLVVWFTLKAPLMTSQTQPAPPFFESSVSRNLYHSSIHRNKRKQTRAKETFLDIASKFDLHPQAISHVYPWKWCF